MARRCSVERANKQIGGFASAKKNIVIHWEICCLNIPHFISSDTSTEGQRRCRPIIFPEMD